MKKEMQYFLMGAGAVIAGFFTYALLSDNPASPGSAAAEETHSADSHIPPSAREDYVARRRELLSKKAVDRTAAAEPTKPLDGSPTELQPADLAQEPAVSGGTEQDGDFGGSSSPTQEGEVAHEDCSLAIDAENPAGSEDSMTSECIAEAILPPTEQDVECPNAEQGQAKETVLGEHSEAQTK